MTTTPAKKRKRGRPPGKVPPRVPPVRLLAMQARGLTYAQIAEKTGLSTTTVGRYLTAGRPVRRPRRPHEPTQTLRLTPSAIATLLAALRLWQERIGDEPGHIPDSLRDHFADRPPLTPEQIDRLCASLNQ